MTQDEMKRAAAAEALLGMHANTFQVQYDISGPT